MNRMKAFVVVDVQNDFLPGGALAIRGGNEILPMINDLFKEPFDLIVASKDWHPRNHASFAANQGKLVGEVISLGGVEQVLWPVHCVQGSSGAQFAPGLETDRIDKIFYKGINENIDSYSCFFDNGHVHSTGLNEYLKGQKIDDLFFAGLATDYCVKYSVADALALGFGCFVIVDCCRGVDEDHNNCQKALIEMQQMGCQLITAKQVRDILVKKDAGCHQG